jgi:hypothetical protein
LPADDGRPDVGFLGQALPDDDGAVFDLALTGLFSRDFGRIGEQLAPPAVLVIKEGRVPGLDHAGRLVADFRRDLVGDKGLRYGKSLDFGRF